MFLFVADNNFRLLIFVSFWIVTQSILKVWEFNLHMLSLLIVKKMALEYIDVEGLKK